jgi:hypothetical protein
LRHSVFGIRADRLFDEMSTDFGIITLSDANYFPGLLMLHRSVQESMACTVACFDVGLSAEQKARAATLRNLEILPLPADPLIPRIEAAMSAAPPLLKVHKRVWPLWICPVLIKHAPFRDVIWMDCDLVVLRRLPQLFAAIESGPVFTPENNAPHATPNRAELYELLPIRRPFNPLVPTINGRDAAAIEAYILPVEHATIDPKVRDAISWQDQGALIWAIQSCGLEHRVAPTNDWNLCVRNTPIADQPITWDDKFIETARATVVNANIIHWNGQRPPWLS